MICPCCQREWNTDINNSCICGAVITKKAPKNLPKADAYSLLAEVRAELERLIDGEYRIFHSDSMDQNTGLEEDLRNLYKKVSEHFS